MKIAIFTDLHWSMFASIVRQRGEKYSTRLEACIKSMNWFEELSKSYNCDLELNLGDFFDKSDGNAEELTALQEIKWNDIPKKFLVGNHEMWNHDLSISSMHTFNLKDNITVIDKPTSELIGDLELCYLPYILESDRLPLKEYFPSSHKKIIFSHNDLLGVAMGKFISNTGFDITEIDSMCELFLNGHIHTGGFVTDKILNLGNLCGLNFNEDASKYSHCAFILDTDTLEINSFENPYSLNFYKIIFDNTLSLKDIKPNSVVAVKCLDKDIDTVRELIRNTPNVIESRINIDKTKVAPDSIVQEVDISGIDHIQKFKDFIIDKLGAGKLIQEELQEITQ